MNTGDLKKYPRNLDSDETKGKSDIIKSEVSKLIKGQLTDVAAMSSLRSKFQDLDMANAIFDAYKERLEQITRKARKFKRAIVDRYSALNLPFNELMRKAKKYAAKYNLSDNEFRMFFDLSITDKDLTMKQFSLPSTKMTKALGHGLLMSQDKLHIKENELGILQDILKLYGETKILHSQVVLQSLTYEECAHEAINNKSNDKINRYSFVHPIIVMLFLPKIDILEKMILLANLGYIVKCKHEGQPILTEPDMKLYHALVSDPNDGVCAFDSAIKDLKNRFILQTRIWDSVLNMRQGKYLNDNLAQFLAAVENCRNNIYDAPDFTYVKDEGTILRRLLSAFSIRPTIVSTSRLYAAYNEQMGQNPYGITSSGYPGGYPGVTEMSTLSVINVRIPLQSNNQTTSLELQSTLTAPQWFIENKMLVPKTQTIMFSQDVLFFYIGRRYKALALDKTGYNFNFNILPMAVSGLEKINKNPIDISEDAFVVGEDSYSLKSTLLLVSKTIKQNDISNEIIIGCSAVIKCDKKFAVSTSTSTDDSCYIYYNPIEYKTTTNDSDMKLTAEPIIGGLNPKNIEIFKGTLKTCSTILMFKKNKPDTK
jgi:hypothetical protein